MAEALAISAAVVQFLDVSFRLSVKLGELVSELHDVPERLRILKSDGSTNLDSAKHQIQLRYLLQFIADMRKRGSTSRSNPGRLHTYNGPGRFNYTVRL